MRNNRDFCEQSFKLVFALLAALVAATGVWAFLAARKARAAAPGRGTGPPSGAALPEAGTPRPDAITMATPKGGLNLITGVAPLPAAMPQSHLQSAFNVVSSRIRPAVVNVNATRDQAMALGWAPGEGIRFAVPFSGGGKQGRGEHSLASVGAGAIIDSRGYILTNYHVISGAENILVSVFGTIGRDFPAAVVAADPRNDLALLKVTGAPPLPEAKLGDSDLVRVGDWVLAFGSPFGLDQTVTQGIISSKRKSLVVEGTTYGDMLQTDAPINRGSSGGPLVNTHAEVIGINTAIYGPGGVFSGTGFAVPINRAKVFLARAKAVLQP